MKVAKKFGTNANNSPDSDYCLYCFKDGAFTNGQWKK